MTSFVAGSDTQGSIPDFLAELPGGLDDRWVVIDSGPPDPESPTIRRAVATFADEVEWASAGLLVPGHCLRSVDCDALFHGFDEVVVFDTSLSASRRPPQASRLIAPCPRTLAATCSRIW